MAKATTTRGAILQKAFELVYRNGFQSTSIDHILASMRVTKGAFFHYFRNKEEMGLALIDEIIFPGMQEAFIRPLRDSVDPVEDIYTMMEHLLLSAPFFQVPYGCPAVNLVEEMSPVNVPFNQALHKLLNRCQQALQASIEEGQRRGTIRPNVDPGQVATFILVGYSGVRNLGKLYGPACYHTYLRELKRYLRQLT
ncbi:MAG: Transcriptional regulator, AcrR family [uncultured Cytophagales bacterium]|uniref:Transcriptional regulator, AcrR family n=1 Tax=uncultured Cytophagales bacterium TaxID=158755 RepID=A0A6J4JY13_9SPHI|nr:MAG: Transcriptional regulator, AcrR family [uncultured Cytophagales bacterium]